MNRSTKGCICFSYRRGKITSKLISFFRSVKFTHTFIMLGNLFDRQIVSEAGVFEVDIVPIDKFLRKDTEIEVWQFEASEKEKQKSLKELMSLVGKRYGYLQAIGFAIQWLLNKFKINIKNPFEGGVICSELVYYYLQKAGYKHMAILGDDANEVAPDHIRKAFLRDGSSKIIGVSRLGEENIEWLGD